MKVLLYLCPDDKLSSVVTCVPPFLVISYMIHIYKDKKIKENEVNL